MSQARQLRLFVLVVGILATVTSAVRAGGLTKQQCGALYAANKVAIDASWPSPAAFINACENGELKNLPASAIEALPQAKAAPPPKP